MPATLSFYNKNSRQMAEQYNSVDFETVHRSWCAYWPQAGGDILDVGAGSGRDSNWFAQQSCSVVAVEPAHGLRHRGEKNTPSSVQWLDDYLPVLNGVKNLSRQYHLILLSAVWMHLPLNQRAEALKTLSELLLDNGHIVITLRHGQFNDGRESFGVSVAEIETLSEKLPLLISHVEEGADSLKRTDVTWQTVVLTKPAAGSCEG